MILYDYIWVALGSIKYAGCFWEFLHLLGTILFILMKKNHFGSDGLVGFCVFCDITLIYCVIFLSMQTGTNGFVLLVSVFLCIILFIYFFFIWVLVARLYITKQIVEMLDLN